MTTSAGDEEGELETSTPLAHRLLPRSVFEQWMRRFANDRYPQEAIVMGKEEPRAGSRLFKVTQQVMLSFQRVADDLWPFYLFIYFLACLPWCQALAVFWVFLVIMLPYQDVVYQDE